MAQQISFEDVQEGTELPPLVKHPSNVQLFLFSTVTRNAHRIHYARTTLRRRATPTCSFMARFRGRSWSSS